MNDTEQFAYVMITVTEKNQTFFYVFRQQIQERTEAALKFVDF